jgi:hypothetical protein
MIDKRLIAVPIMIFLMLFVVEFMLEARHYSKGLTPPFFQLAKSLFSVSQAGALSLSNNTIERPFVNNNHTKSKAANVRRIWVSSASHAIMGAKEDSTFPEKICEYARFDKGGCETLNGSSPGEDVEGNIKRIESYADQYAPDIVVLYQMSQEINKYARLGFGKTRTAFGDEITSNPLISSEPIKKWLETTSAYGHLREYISGFIVLQAPLHNKLPDNLVEEFRVSILNFVASVRAGRAVPVLMTFSASYNRENVSHMNFYTKLTLMRYQQALSVRGWVTAIAQLNEVIREVSKNNNVLLIDLQKAIDGRPEFFSDFVHFNAEGHAAVAREIGRSLSEFTSNGYL